MNERDFTKIPAEACVLHVGEFELGDNGGTAKTAPVRLVARTGKAIEHWFWGRIVHDLAGMHLHKPRIPIDYLHDGNQVIGYLNKFDVASGDLVTSGALVPFKESDRATEIIHKSRAGVPYEASINFGGDGIKIEDVPEGHTAQVNGFQFDGPGVIVREWPLRGVAICPYGADANTASAVLSEKGKTFSASVIAAPEATTKEPAMSTPVEVEAQAAAPEAAKVLEQEKPEAVEVTPVEAKATEAAQPAAVEVTPAVEAKPPEAQPEAVPAAEAKPALSREEFARIADRFGNDIAAQIMRDGGDYSAALALYAEAMEAENKKLRERVAEQDSIAHGGVPVPVTEAKPKARLFNTGK
jgi:hypothetical protein